MPTLVWIRRPESGTGAAAGRDSARKAAAAIPDPVVSAATAVSDPAHVALPAVSSTRRAEGGKKKKRKTNRAEAATTSKKKSKTTSERDLPTGVYKLPSGKYESRIWWDGKNRWIGTFDTPEQASAACASVRKEIDDAELSGLGADEAKATFDEAKKKAVEAVGGLIQEKRDLPQGVQKKLSGRFQAKIQWGDKQRNIGTFDTPEQASAAYMSVKKDLDDGNVSTVDAGEVDAMFDAAKTKALEAVGRFVTVTRDLPRGVTKSRSGKFISMTGWGGKKYYIGTFDTPEQASAAYISVKKDLDDANLSSFGSHDVDAIFDAAKKKAQDTFGGFVPEERDLPRGVTKVPSGMFAAQMHWGGKNRLVGTFDTPERASAAYVSVKSDLAEIKSSAFGADEIDAIFKKKALETVGISSAKKRDLPRGVYQTPSGKYVSRIQWGGKTRNIGTFDTPEQASAAFVSVRKDLAGAKPSALGADEVKAMFDAAKKKALEAVIATR